MRWAWIPLFFAVSEASLGGSLCGAGPMGAPRPSGSEGSGKMWLPAFCGLGCGGASLLSRAAEAAGRGGGLVVGGGGLSGRTCSAHAPSLGGASTRRRGAASISMMSDSDLDPMSRRDRIKATKRAGGDEEKPMLFVGNLPWVLDSWGLEKLFEPYGKVRRHLSNAQMCVKQKRADDKTCVLQLWVFTARAWGCKWTPRSMCVAPASHGPSNIGLHVP
jgi:hypothetical protein